MFSTGLNSKTQKKMIELYYILRQWDSKSENLQKNSFFASKTIGASQRTFKTYFLNFHSFSFLATKNWIVQTNTKAWKMQKCFKWLRGENFKIVGETWNFFSLGNFHRRFEIWAQKWQKFCNLTHGRHFCHFWHFREDLSGQAQNLQK